MEWFFVQEIGRADPLANIIIDRLSLKLSALSARDGERLARRLADALGTAAVAREGPLHLDGMQVNVTAELGTPMDTLSQRIVAAVLLQLDRTV